MTNRTLNSPRCKFKKREHIVETVNLQGFHKKPPSHFNTKYLLYLLFRSDKKQLHTKKDFLRISQKDSSNVNASLYVKATLKTLVKVVSDCW